MVMGKWMARKGAVGGTARFVAKAYRHSLENKLINPANKKGLSKGIQKVVITALDLRFSGNDANPDYCEILESFNNLSFTKGLGDFVLCILLVETNFSKNTPEYRAMFNEIIDEELEKGGVPESFITGYP